MLLVGVCWWAPDLCRDVRLEAGLHTRASVGVRAKPELAWVEARTL
jgi:hypothetical protein